MSERAAGVLLHFTSLPSRFPIGDLGPAADAFADFLVESGQRWWQVLPVGPTGDGDSPYQSQSAFAGNPLLLSPERLVEQGLLASRDIEPLSASNPGSVDYSVAARLKTRLLRAAFARFEGHARGAKRAELDAFAKAGSFWLPDLALFLAIQEREGTQWTRWSRKLRLRAPDEIARAREELATEIRYHEFVQWQFAVQWKELRTRCTVKGLGLIGDIPLFVAHQSADVWTHPGLFKLTVDGSPSAIAGVPPDQFSPSGQVWDVPVYQWDSLKGQGYAWWIERLRMASTRFDVNRLDHFIGFVRTYEVPARATTAAGHYEAGGGAPFFDAIRTALGSLSFIADDLGATTTEVVALMDRFQIPGTRVLQFELEAELRGDRRAPHPMRTVVYTGTHDTDTTAGWSQALPNAETQALLKVLATAEETIAWAVIGRALAGDSELAIVPAQDLLGLGSEARMNLPGRAKGNWRWRVQENTLTREISGRLQHMTAKYGRSKSGMLHQPHLQDSADRVSQIARRAYELYEGRGCASGAAEQDWFKAERELRDHGLA